MTEAWEDILLEMDSKLYNFAEQKQVSKCLAVKWDILSSKPNNNVSLCFKFMFI